MSFVFRSNVAQAGIFQHGVGFGLKINKIMMISVLLAVVKLFCVMI